MQWERTSEGLVRTLLRYPYFNQFIWSNLPIGPREEGKRWAVGNLKGGCVCHLDTYIPVFYFFFLEYWFWSVKQKGKSEMSEEKKAWKGVRTSLRYSYLSQLLRYILLINTMEVERKEVSVKEFWKGRGAVCHSDMYFSQFLWLLVLISQTEWRKRDEQWREPLKGGGVRTSLRIHSSINSYHILDRSDRWALTKMVQSSSVSHSNINTSVNSFCQFFDQPNRRDKTVERNRKGGCVWRRNWLFDRPNKRETIDMSGGKETLKAGSAYL